MRGASLRIKINIAILLAFVVAALAFGGILTFYMADRQASTQNRTRVLLAALAAHRLEALTPMLNKNGESAPAQDILKRLVRVEGVIEASLFDAQANVLATAGEQPVAPLRADPDQPLPTGRVYTVSAEDGKLTAMLVEPITLQGRSLGYLRLRYSLKDLGAFNRQTWFVFGLAVAGAYLLLATLLNIMLHRFVLHPVDTLRQGLEAVQAGKLGHAVPVASKDALGRTAMAFNAMSTRLKETSECLAESRAEIEENRRLLARRVEERTAELALANKRLLAEIEARREAEVRQQRALALYKAILESTAEAVLCVGAAPDREVLAYNRRFLELWGLPDDWPTITERDVRIQAVLDRVKDPEEVGAAFMALLADDKRLDVACLELRDGRYLQRRSGPIMQGETYIGRVLSYVDVTADKKREVMAEQAKVKAEDASKAKGAFLAVMSHEIRTPLNVVIGLTEELLAGPASEEQHGYLRTIQESAAHLLGVVNDILDFSKIEAGKLVLDRIDFNLRELVSSVAGALAQQVRQKNLEFTVTVAEAVPHALRGDPGRLRQVLFNLLYNAVKFTDAGAVSLTVELAAQAAGPEGRIGILVRIEDTGIGIDAGQLAELFENFNQGGGSIARRFGGTGLGLAISRGIVERMGGCIEVQSRPGAGSVFTFTVWFLPGREAALAAPERPDTVHRRLRILLVEDNALNAAVTRLHLGRMGHDLTVAASAREAYGLLARERYDAVLMDIEMPEIDGITATRTIRAGGEPGEPLLDPRLPIIAVTAHAVEDVRQQCLEAGMSGFVTKPVNYRTLQQVLEAMGRTGESPPAAASRQGGEHALFDPQAAREAMGISWDQYRDLSQVSFTEGERRLVEAGAALATGDTEGAAIAAHTIKGAAATLGAYSCRELAGSLEKALRGGDAVTAGQAYEVLVSLWEKVRQAYAGWHPPQGE